MEKEYCKILLNNHLTASEALVCGVRINAFCKRLTQWHSISDNSLNRVVFFILVLVSVVRVFV